MSLRAYTDHVDDYNRTHTIEIHKSGYSGPVDYLKNTGSGYASFDYEKIDPKNPTDNPIQKGVLEFSLWLQSSNLIDEIKTADEQTFWAVHKVDGTQEWIGYIYNDLSTYEEGFENHPFRITLMAKDFTDLGGKDYLVSGSLPDSRERVIATIAHLLDTVGFDMPIKTHTSWIEENLSGDYDYLNEIYHETKALREFGRTGDETDQPITVEDALNKLCVNHGLLLKQADGAYWIDQLTEYQDPTSVQEAEYDLTGAQSSLTTGNNLTVNANTSDLKVTIDQDNRDNSGLPGLKRVKNKYDHRTGVATIQFPDIVRIEDTSESPQQFLQAFISDGDQQIEFRSSLEAQTDDTVTEQYALYTIEAGSYYWDEENHEWVDGTFTDNRIDMTDTWASGGKLGWMGSVDITTSDVPADADGNLVIEIYISRSDSDGAGDYTEWKDTNINIVNAIADENSTSINYQLTQTGSYSVVGEIEDTWYGDLPTGYSVGALRYGTNAGDLTTETWQRKGSTDYRNFHHNLLAEHLDVRRGWRRLLSATLKGLYYPWQILSYDSEYFYFLGGSWDLFTGNWECELLSLDIQTGSDIFDDIPKFTDETGSGTGSTGGSSGGGGLDQSTADNRYFKQSSLFSEIASGDQNEAISNLGITATKDELNRLDGDLATVQSNLGLTDGSADLDLASLDIDSLNFNNDTISSSGNIVLDAAGDVLINGDTIKVDKEMTTTDNVIVLNDGETGSGITAGEAGLRFDRGTGDDYEILFQESDQLFSVGKVGDLQPVLTREVSPDTDGLFYFDDTDSRATTSGDLTFDGTTLEVPEGTFSDGLSVGTSDKDSEVHISAADELLTLQIEGDARWHFRKASEFDNKYGSRDLLLNQYTGTDDGQLIFNADTVFPSNVLSHDFDNTTWAGSGYRGTNEGDWVVENLRVRNALEVYEFVAKQISFVGGKEVLSIGNGRIESIDEGGSTIDIQDVRNQGVTSFKAGDLWEVHVSDINNDLESGGSGAVVRNAYGTVTNVSGTTLTLSFDSGAISDLQENDFIALYGSSDSNRNSIMYRNVDRSDDELITRVQTDVTSRSALTAIGNTRFAYGDVVDYWNDSTGESQTEVFGSFAGDINDSHILATDQGVLLRGVDLDVQSLPQVRDDELIAHYRFDGSVIDAISGDTATISGSPDYVDGVAGRALNFNGSDEELQISPITFSGNFSISIHFYVDSFDDDFRMFLGGTGNEKIGYDPDGDFFVRVIDGGDVDRFIAVPDTGWNHIVIRRFTDDVVYISVNGGDFQELFGGVAQSGDSEWEWIGSGDQFWRGAIDEVRFYDRFIESDIAKSLFLYPSGNSGGLISADTVVATEGFFDDLFSTNATVDGGTLTLANGASLVSDDSSILINHNTFQVDTGENGGGFTNANFFADSSTQELSLGSVFSADGGADTGTLAGINFDSAKLFTGDGTNGYVGLGATSGADDPAFWAGADNQDGSGGASANNFLVTQGGDLFYDGIYQVIYAAESLADFGTNNEADGIFNDEWEVSAIGAGGGANESPVELRILEKKYIRRNGVNSVRMEGFLEYVSEQGTGGQVEVTLSAGGNLDTHTITAVGGETFSLQVDVSGSQANIEVAVDLTATVDGSTIDDSVTGALREDMIIIGVTDEI